MNIYAVWVNLAPGAHDLEFVNAVHAYMQMLQDHGLSQYRIVRRKFGFGPPELGEFFITMEFASLTQLDEAFMVAATRSDPAEGLHHAVFSQVTDFKSALYRDFPDPVRVS